MTARQKPERDTAAAVRHIGYLSLCRAHPTPDHLARIDLGSARYKRLGVRERFVGELPYRVCRLCIAKVEARERYRHAAAQKKAKRK